MKGYLNEVICFCAYDYASSKTNIEFISVPVPTPGGFNSLSARTRRPTVAFVTLPSKDSCQQKNKCDICERKRIAFPFGCLKYENRNCRIADKNE
ncbi:hypothetical protein CEXT_653721 [Caerostris extrusa]|uniref:Uncharacterized protein n=1 Tax=Caerostris extrusa TaxID=172846 RepID=A0AAV4M4Q3_CAEEX|nr:hypothetical protein CEXT_653721 [Caerostris extrusa]